jgi:peptidoglycan/LPS O-acetylase OafA/YrhL
MPWLGPFVDLSRKLPFRIDLLYLLSGFMLAYIYLKPNEPLSFKVYRGFLWHRWVALYPAHLVTLLLLIIAALLSTEFHASINADSFASYSALPFQFTLTQRWPFLPDMGRTWNYPTWFLSVLWLGYITTFPFAWILLQRLKESRYALLWAFGPLLFWLGVSRFKQLEELHNFVRAVCGLLSGVALCSVFLGRSRFVESAQRHLDKIVLLYLALFLFAYDYPVLAYCGVVAGMPFLLAGLTAKTSFTAKVMASRPVMWLGVYSYSIFMSHALAIKFIKVLLPTEHFVNSPLYVRISVALAYKIAVICFAWALYTCVERPCKKFLKDFRSKRCIADR